MGIDYERIMTLTYPVRMTNQQYSKLASRLNDKGIMLGGVYSWNTPESEEFGYRAKTATTRRNVLYANDKAIAECRIYESVLKEVHDELLTLFPDLDIDYGQTNVEVTSKKWFEPNGSYVYVSDLKVEGDVSTYNLFYDFDGVEAAIKMNVRIFRDVSKPVLEFKITWSPEKTQKKVMIEEALVDIVLGDMNLMTTTLERILKAKKDWGWDGEEVDIDCHFNAITNRRSDCAPDIVAMVRAERQAEA